MPFATTSTSLRRLPLFFAYCPDRANVLPKRLEVRPTHWARWAKDREDGYGEFGLGFRPQPSPSSTSPYASAQAQVDPNPAQTAGVQPMAGSLLIFRATNLDEAWARIKDDVYWTEGVWERGKCVVEEFIRHEYYHDEV